MPRKNPNASALGRLGGSAKSKAKTTTARANGAKGGRPVRTRTVKAPDGSEVVAHADARHVGFTVDGRPAFIADTPTADRWMWAHGFERGHWPLSEALEAFEGRTWAKPIA